MFCLFVCVFLFCNINKQTTNKTTNICCFKETKKTQKRVNINKQKGSLGKDSKQTVENCFKNSIKNKVLEKTVSNSRTKTK